MKNNDNEFYDLIEDFLFLSRSKRLKNIFYNVIVFLMFLPALLSLRTPLFLLLFVISLTVVNFFLLVNKDVSVRKGKLKSIFAKNQFAENGKVNLGALEYEISRLRRERKIQETDLKMIVKNR